MLHITNGDSAADRIRAAGIAGTILPWRDVLHEGPVPGGLPLERLSAVRADYIASLGWGSKEELHREFAERDRALMTSVHHDEVVLWFEHDLYDQLQLIQLLDWYADHPHPRLTLINPAEYLGSIDEEHARELFEARQPATPGQLALGRWAWDAFRANDPRHIETVMYADDADGLPHLPEALFRLLEEYPVVGTGLSRSDEQILIAFSAEAITLAQAYPASHHDVEEAVWMGDATWMSYVERLASGRQPLLAFVDDGARQAVAMQRRARVTDAGREVLWGRADAVWINGIDRWIGGVHLSGREIPWRWDADEECIVQS
jgi:hypothetical protein